MFRIHSHILKEMGDGVAYLYLMIWGMYEDVIVSVEIIFFLLCKVVLCHRRNLLFEMLFP